MKKFVWAVYVFICSLWLLAVPAFAGTYTLDVRNGMDITDEFNSTASKARNGETVTIVIPSGTYYTTQLKVWSNTTVKMGGVTLIHKNGDSTMLRLGHLSSDWAGAGHPGYSGFSNITFIGGTWDGGNHKQSLMRFGHSTNITLQNVSFRNVNNTHHVEFGACSNVNITGCTFTGFNGNFSGNSNVEALQIDCLAGGHFSAYPPNDDETPSKNINITGCTFSGLKRGVGTHTGVTNSYHSNIHIDNNRFENITGYAITMINYINSSANGNTIYNCGAGILCGTVDHSYNNFYAGTKTGSGRSKYAKLNTTIDRNNITITAGANGSSYYLDNYGIRLLGNKLTKKYINMPKGDWRISGVNVRNNTINMNVTGLGIMVQGGIKDTISKNVINVNARTKGRSTKLYGINVDTGCESINVSANVINNMYTKGVANKMTGIRVLSGKSIKVEKNRITGASVDGIRIEKSKKTQILANTIIKCGRYGINATKAMISKDKSNKITGAKKRAKSWTKKK